MTGTVLDGNFRHKAPGFSDPTQLPQGETERKAWQDAHTETMAFPDASFDFI